MIKIGVICSDDVSWRRFFAKLISHEKRLVDLIDGLLSQFVFNGSTYEKFIAGTCLASRLKSYDRLTFSGIFTSDQIQGYLIEWGKGLTSTSSEAFIHNYGLCYAEVLKVRKENSELTAKLMTANRDLTAARNDLNTANRESASRSSRVDELTVTVGTLKGQLCAARDELLKCREDNKRLALDNVDLKQILSHYQAKLSEVANTQVPRYVMAPTDFSIVEKLKKELVDLQASYDDLLSTKKRLEASLAETQRDHGKSFAEISRICDKHT
jgi:regulator of replication initiation timing